jgi:hypothetical protein
MRIGTKLNDFGLTLLAGKRSRPSNDETDEISEFVAGIDVRIDTSK